jgi:CBS domain-containing protein
MKVKEVMTPHPSAIQASASLADAAEEMRRRNSRSLPVAEGERLVGIISQRDLVFAAEGTDNPEQAPHVSDAVRSEVAVCNEEDDLDQTLALMAPGGIRRMLVLNADGKLTGILSLNQLGEPGEELADEEMGMES